MIGNAPQTANACGSRQLMIPEGQGYVERALVQLLEDMQVLQSRLVKVSRSAEPTPSTTDSKEPQATCELAEWLRQVSSQINRVGAQVNFMVEHLEV